MCGTAKLHGEVRHTQRDAEEVHSVDSPSQPPGGDYARLAKHGSWTLVTAPRKKLGPLEPCQTKQDREQRSRVLPLFTLRDEVANELWGHGGARDNLPNCTWAYLYPMQATD